LRSPFECTGPFTVSEPPGIVMLWSPQVVSPAKIAHRLFVPAFAFAAALAETETELMPKILAKNVGALVATVTFTLPESPLYGVVVVVVAPVMFLLT
jgi:hypothetical protein